MIKQVKEDDARLMAGMQDSVNSLKADLATKGSAEDLGRLSGDVTGVKSDLEAIKQNIQTTRGELGTLIAQDRDAIAQLRRAAQRDHYEFTIDHKGARQKVGNLELELRGTNVKKNSFSVAVYVDGTRYEKRNRSVNQPIYLHSPVPVLTIGPWVRRGFHSDGRFHRVLFPTDFSPESIAAAPYAVSLAQENQARLVLLHVIPRNEEQIEANPGELSVADAMYQLNEMLPKGAELWCRPDAAVEYGEPAQRILEATKKHGGDLIVLGVRSQSGRLGAATHLERTTAHKVVAHAICPVLTVRG